MKFKTLTEFIIEKQSEYPQASGELSRLLNDIGIAAKFVNKEVNRAGLGDVMGYAGEVNVQGEEQKKLDVYANEQFIEALKSGGQCCAIGSEENEEIILLDSDVSKHGKYVVAIDPLDGSSNIESNVSIGTLFSIYRRRTVRGSANLEDFLQPGRNLVAAGYVIYGSSTMLVYTTGYGVNGFTLDPSVGLFILSHPDMKYPEKGTIYSINEANYFSFPEGVRKYIHYCQEEDELTNRPYSTRYIGSMVADIHRNMGFSSIPAPRKARKANYVCSMNAVRWPSWPSRPAAKPPMVSAGSWIFSLQCCMKDLRYLSGRHLWSNRSRTSCVSIHRNLNLSKPG